MRFSRGILLFLCLLFSACSLPVQTGSNTPMHQAAGPSGLMRIKITSWGIPRFSGLLGLQFHDSGLTYMLLDATGLKLLESKINMEGDFSVIHAAGTLRDSGLPEFLASSLRKIYLITPSTEPCADSLLVHFCMEKTDGKIVRKHVSTGPISLWEVNYNGADPPGVSFSEPLFGITLTMAGLNRPQQSGEQQ